MVYIVGVGPGSPEHVTSKALDIINRSDILVGGRRNLKTFEHLNKQTCEITSNLSYVLEFLNNNKEKNISVLASGDPGLFSITKFLKRHGIQPEVIPGISALQYLCSKVALSWDDAKIISLHGNDNSMFVTKLADSVAVNRKTVIFTDGVNTPGKICEILSTYDFNHLHITVGENLSYPDEKIIEGDLESISKMNFSNLSIMLIQNTSRQKSFSMSIPDHMFIRGDVPMTKEEVRCLIVSKLGLEKDSIVWDIGAGTGSVTVQCALFCSGGKVYAVEKNFEAVKLAEQNVQKFRLNNVEIICGNAPLDIATVPDRVFIGGSGGSMDSILEWINKMRGGIVVVISAVTVESVYEALTALEKYGFTDTEIISVQISRGKKLGGKHIMQALNNVYIIKGVTKQPLS